MSDNSPPFRQEQIERAWQLLSRNGYFNDESSGLGARAVQHHLAQVTVALRQCGYDGPELAHGGHYYSERGNVHWAYDPGRVSQEEARAHTDQWVRQQLHP